MMQLIKNLWAPKFLFAIATVYTILLTLALLLPSQGSPLESFKNVDKLFHIVLTMVLILVWLTYTCVKSKGLFATRTLIGIVIAVFFYGIIIEILQEQFTNTRTAELQDVIANCIGLILGVVVFNKFLKSHLKT